MAKLPNRYKITQKLLSIGDDFWIENQEGKKVFKVDGKTLRIRKTLVFEDANAKPLCSIKERLLALRDSMEIEDADGRTIAVIRKALIAPLRDRWTVNIRNGPDLAVVGNILDLEYTIKQKGRKVAEISRKWFTVTDTYGVEIAEGQEDVVILAVAVALDMMTHDN
jgi:uncharacterized protein YxjI